MAPSEQRFPAFSEAKQKNFSVNCLEAVDTEPMVEMEYKSQARLSVCLLACFSGWLSCILVVFPVWSWESVSVGSTYSTAIFFYYYIKFCKD